jgi:CRP/FNR family cyclic AMP-dependent transcriptional regulator
MKARTELLQRMPIFAGVREETLEFLLGLSRTVVRSAGEFFFLEHEPGSSLFVLEVGSVAVLKRWQGTQYALRTFSRGDCFGEMAIIELMPRSASVRAEVDCIAVEISAADLYQLYERNVDQFALIQMNMARELSRRLREADQLRFRSEVDGLSGDRPRPL